MRPMRAFLAGAALGALVTALAAVGPGGDGLGAPDGASRIRSS